MPSCMVSSGENLEIETMSRQNIDDPFIRFRQYETLHIQDYYEKLVNQWRAAFIYATLILLFPDEDVRVMQLIFVGLRPHWNMRRVVVRNGNVNFMWDAFGIG